MSNNSFNRQTPLEQAEYYRQQQPNRFTNYNNQAESDEQHARGNEQYQQYELDEGSFGDVQHGQGYAYEQEQAHDENFNHDDQYNQYEGHSAGGFGVNQQQPFAQQQQRLFSRSGGDQRVSSHSHDGGKGTTGAFEEKKVFSPNKSSKEVLHGVFSHSNQQDYDVNRIAENLSRVHVGNSFRGTNEDGEFIVGQEGADDADNDVQQIGENGGELNEDTQQLENEEIDLALFDECYKTFLEMIAGDQEFVDATYEAKIGMLMDFSRAESVETRLGSLIFLFELVYNFRESLTEAALSQILLEIYQNIPLYYETKDFYVVYCALEIIALIGPHSVSYSNIKLLASILIDEALPMLQDKAFLAIINLDYPGFHALLDIANKDYNNVPIFLLNKLAQTQEMQLSVIIPALLNDINMIGDMKKRISSLAALNRMHSMIWKANSLPLLVNLLHEGTLDRQLIVSTIRACGEIGEMTLFKILKQCKNSKIKMAISTVLSWRVGKFEKSKLDIRIVPYNIAQHYNVNPGTMCIYFGDQTPLAFVDPQQASDDPAAGESQERDYIEINTRDFMAALQRLLAVKYDRFSQQESNYETGSRPHDFSPFISDFSLIKLIDPNAEELQTQTGQQIPISQQIIKTLSSLLQDQDAQVRETAVSSLGLIGLPEAEQAIEPLYAALQDPESQVRAMAAWCLGRLGESNPLKVAKRLIVLLKDNFWKVRTAACVSLGSLGSSVSDIAFPALTKILRDGSINKVTVCETIVRLGVYGEQILIDILKNVPQSNFKLKTAIIQAFELADVQKPTIDFVIEEIFRNASDKMIEVRKACLQSLNLLRKREQDKNITYLKSQNILPLFYYFLQDSCAEIRQVINSLENLLNCINFILIMDLTQLALESISSFGPQAELMFIEGLTKDKNYIVRSECATGLGKMGPQNFRALLFGLRDVHEGVRKATAIAVKSNFVAEQIIEEFQDKPNQLPALLCNIKDIYSLPFYFDDDCKRILNDILKEFGEDYESINQNNNNNNNHHHQMMEHFSAVQERQPQRLSHHSFEQGQQGVAQSHAANQSRMSNGSVSNKNHDSAKKSQKSQQKIEQIQQDQFQSQASQQQSQQQQQQQQRTYQNILQTHMPATKVNKNVPNMRGGMPAYVLFKPGGGGSVVQTEG